MTSPTSEPCCARRWSETAIAWFESEKQVVLTGDLKIDLLERTVRRGNAEVHLTPKEWIVLSELGKFPGRVLTHAHLLRSAWGPAQEKQTEYLRVLVRSLRQKVEPDSSRPTLILNEPGVGYRLMIIEI